VSLLLVRALETTIYIRADGDEFTMNYSFDGL